MHLKEGVNKIRFTVSSQSRGRVSIVAKLFKWEPDSKIVVSDVDGTITRSDVMGQIMPMLGRDWSHAGVAQLYSNVFKNGYKIMYLSSRAIGQSGITKDYLQGVKQGTADGTGEEHNLPDGPVILSPDRLFKSFTREVIQRRPQVRAWVGGWVGGCVGGWVVPVSCGRRGE